MARTRDVAWPADHISRIEYGFRGCDMNPLRCTKEWRTQVDEQGTRLTPWLSGSQPNRGVRKGCLAERCPVSDCGRPFRQKTPKNDMKSLTGRLLQAQRITHSAERRSMVAFNDQAPSAHVRAHSLPAEPAPHLMPKHSFDPPGFRQDEMSRVTLPAE